MKKIVILMASLVVSIAVAIVPSTAFAANNQVDVSDPMLFLIDEQQYFDEYGELVVERFYSSINPRAETIESVNLSITDATGSGTFRNEKDILYSGITITCWVQGYFSWDEAGDVVYVTNVTSGHSSLGNIIISNESTTSQSNAGISLFWGLLRKYAFAKYSFTLTNPVGLSSNYNVEVKVHNNGQ